MHMATMIVDIKDRIHKKAYDMGDLVGIKYS